MLSGNDWAFCWFSNYLEVPQKFTEGNTDGFDTIKVKLKHPAVLERKDYGWQSFVEYVECLNLTDANEYMYRLGYLLFISFSWKREMTGSI